MRFQLEEYYGKVGLDKNDGKDCPSFKKCQSSCRLAGKNIMPPSSAFIGDNYDKFRVLFLGINTNRGSANSGEFYSAYDWISGPSTENSVYIDGTIHRIIKKLSGKDSLKPEDSRAIFAFTNVVKCSVDKDAGNPTEVMCVNCVYKHGYTFEEIKLLKPKLIIALGDKPFNAIRNEFIDSVENIDHLFANWIFSFGIDYMSTAVIGLYNPGQGYRTPRSIFKKIREGKHIEEEWKMFISDDFKEEDDLAQALERRYPKENRIDKANPFYDAIFNKLISIAKENDFEF